MNLMMLGSTAGGFEGLTPLVYHLEMEDGQSGPHTYPYSNASYTPSVGDLVIGFHSMVYQVISGLTTYINDFTQIALEHGDSIVDATTYVGYRIMDGTETTISVKGVGMSRATSTLGFIVFAAGDYDPVNFLDTTATTANGTEYSPTIPSITTATDNAYVLSVVAQSFANGEGAEITTSNYTEYDSNFLLQASDTRDHLVGVFRTTQETAGLFTPGAANVSYTSAPYNGWNSWSAVTVAIRKA